MKTPIPNRVLARCPATRRVLVSGPEVAPAALKWVSLREMHRYYLGFNKAVVRATEKAAYEAAVAKSYAACGSEYGD
jgi:hypothetical protein